MSSPVEAPKFVLPVLGNIAVNLESVAAAEFVRCDPRITERWEAARPKALISTLKDDDTLMQRLHQAILYALS